jgi:7 transmembrane sweet-taste receptor of 3 GCPR
MERATSLIPTPISFPLCEFELKAFFNFESSRLHSVVLTLFLPLPPRVINLLVIAAALAEAWFARNLSTEFQESNYIFRSILLIVLVLFIGVPVIFLSRDNPDASVFIGCAMIFVICMGILLMIFLPKMRYRKEGRSGTDVKITGLDIVSGTGSATNSTVPVIAFPNSHASDDDTASYEGERILTTKTQRQLAEEVALLKKLLHAKDGRGAAGGASSGAHREDVEMPSRGSAEMSAMSSAEDAMAIIESTKTVNHLSCSSREQDLKTQVER